MPRIKKPIATTWQKVFGLPLDQSFHGLVLVAEEITREGVNTKPDGEEVPWVQFEGVDVNGEVEMCRWFNPSRDIVGATFETKESAWKGHLLAIGQGDGGLRVLDEAGDTIPPVEDPPPVSEDFLAALTTIVQYATNLESRLRKLEER